MKSGLKCRIIVLACVSVLSLFGAVIMFAGVYVLLRGHWLGIAAVVSGAMILAVPAALCITQIICNSLYGSETNGKGTGATTNTRSHHSNKHGACTLCEVIRCWLSAGMRGARLPFWEIYSMRKRGTPPAIIVDAYVMIRRTGIPVPIGTLEDIYINEHNRIHDAFDLVHRVTESHSLNSKATGRSGRSI